MKILSIIILLTYTFGLSHYLISNIAHIIHHSIAHTLYQHHNHSHNDIKSHGHSHNSFVDYSLFVEENKNHNETKNNNSTTLIEVNYFNHLFCFNSTPDVHLCYSELANHSISDFIINQDKKPPYPPPRICCV